jgi:hypothetical protein
LSWVHSQSQACKKKKILYCDLQSAICVLVVPDISFKSLKLTW